MAVDPGRQAQCWLRSSRPSPRAGLFSAWRLVLNKVYSFWLLIRKAQWIRAQTGEPHDFSAFFSVFQPLAGRPLLISERFFGWHVLIAKKPSVRDRCAEAENIEPVLEVHSHTSSRLNLKWAAHYYSQGWPHPNMDLPEMPYAR